MPRCSRAKNPKGIEIVFTEDDHKYKSNINGKDLVYTSGTQFCGMFFPEFDPTGEITKKCALREGITVEQIKEKWAAKGRESCRLGTRMHEVCEDIFLGNKQRNVPENDIEKKRFDNAVSIAQKIKQRLDILGVEKIVFDHDLGIAGTIDFFGRSKKDGTYVIIDHKSNSEIDIENKFRSFGIGPASSLPGTNFGHYIAQLNLYQYILKFGQYVPYNAKFKMFLNHVTEDTVKLIEVPDAQDTIKDMIIDFLLKKISRVII